MPVGFIRRLARTSAESGNTLTTVENWTTQETDTYDANDPADGPAPYGGTVANLDRVLTATGSGYTVLGLLLTFVNKPPGNQFGQTGSFGGVIVKVTPTFPTGSTAALEVWSLQGSTWTKRRRIPLAGLVRSGETVVIDALGPVLATTAVDAYWVTLAPDIGSETITWLACHVYGICLNDPVTPDCPPGTEPEECDGPECGVDYESWVCLDPPEEPNPPSFPFTLAPIPVKIAFPPARAGCSSSEPPFNRLTMTFGDIPSGGSVVVTAPVGYVFTEGSEQTISAPGDLTWTIESGIPFSPGGPGVIVFPTSTQWPAALGPNYSRLFTNEDGMTFLFTRRLDASVFATAGNLLNILMYYWTTGYEVTYVC